jgi:hypothetical protein
LWGGRRFRITPGEILILDKLRKGPDHDVDYLAKHQVEASVWYPSPNQDASVRDISRAFQLSSAINNLLDAAQV